MVSAYHQTSMKQRSIIRTHPRTLLTKKLIVHLRMTVAAGFAAFALIACNRPAEAQNSKQEPAPVSHATNPYYSRTDTTTLHVSDAEWKKILPDSVYRVAREKDTELAFTGKYWNFEGIGTYYCAVCGNALFKSDSKFASTCGWPSFFQPIRPNSVVYEPDRSFGMMRTEVLCGRCGSHLGHVFKDGPPPTGLRYCMNSIVLDFVPDK